MIKTEVITYSDGKNTFEGLIAYNSEFDNKRPVVLVTHTYSGQSDFENEKAIELAKLGYVGFAIDLYGKGRRASSPQEAQALMDELNNNRALLLERMQTSIKKARDLELADVENISAIGFCFGGKCVLDLARSGEDLKGAVTFHAIYDKPNLNHDKKVKASFLILHGWEDPLAKPQDTVGLATELTELGVDWEINAYGNTVHAFTNPMANLPELGMCYSPTVTIKAWNRMERFLEEVFKKSSK